MSLSPFTIAKTRKQPKCPSSDERIKKMWSRYITLLSHKKEWNNTICSNLDATRDDHSNEVSQKETDKYHIITLMWNLKYDRWTNLWNRIIAVRRKKKRNFSFFPLSWKNKKIKRTVNRPEKKHKWVWKS